MGHVGNHSFSINLHQKQHSREKFSEGMWQDLVCEELQTPYTKEFLYLKQSWKVLLGQFTLPALTTEEAMQQHQVWGDNS